MAHDGTAADDAAAPLLAPSSAKSGKPRRNIYAFACATLASMTTILMGYNLALMSGAQLFIREDLGLSDAQIEVLAGSINVFMLMSILAAGWAAVLGATVAVGVVKMCFVLVATLFSDRLGRRPLLLASTAGVAASMASLGVTLCVGAAASAAGTAASVVSVLAFMAAFSVGFGPLAGTYSAEIMPLRLRAQGASLGMAVNRLTCALVSMTFISLADAITMPGCFFLYAGVGAAACAFVYARMPETKGRSLEDMHVLFAK